MWLLLLAGCPLPKQDDSVGGTGPVPTEDSADEATSTTARTDSCGAADVGICWEYVEYARTRAWCEAVASAYDLDARYDPAPCPSGAVVACSIPAAGGTDFDHDAEAYYYAPDYDASTGDYACRSAGGTPHTP